MYAEEGGGQGPDVGDQLLLDQPVHQMGDVTKKLLQKDNITASTNS
jgi:hypothetical protein